jgi:phosphatidylglycerophosphate synthase
MQAVIAIPELPIFALPGKAEEYLLQPICGVPLLTRVLATARKAGADSLLLIWPVRVPDYLRQQVLRSRLLRGLPATVVDSTTEFNPGVPSNWASLTKHLSREFVWIPWNWVTTKQCLKQLPSTAVDAADWKKPVRIDCHAPSRGDSHPASTNHSAAGVAVTSPERAREAECFMVAHSGKSLDGIHTSFNRRLCRPIVRWLSHTHVTPNQVSVAGLLVAIISCWAFTHGSYWWYVLGALLFFVAGLVDEMDGMLARIKFADSPFGCWLEGAIDGLSYLLLFGGMTVGLFREHGRSQLIIGSALLIGATLSLIVTSLQRRRATSPDRPQEYLGNFYHLLESDSSSPLSRIVRQVQPFMKKGVMIHYLVVFTVLNGLRVFFYLSAFGSHLTWTLGLYFSRRYFRKPYQDQSTPIPHTRKVHSYEGTHLSCRTGDPDSSRTRISSEMSPSR